MRRMLLIVFFMFVPIYLTLAQSYEEAQSYGGGQEYVGDSENGSIIYRRCVACHYLEEDRNKVGPSLKNLMGSQAGTKEGYRYSPAMKQAGENGLIWNRDTLIEYLHNPQAMVRGTRMAAIRITSQQDIDDLIAYIIKVSQEAEKETQ